MHRRTGRANAYNSNIAADVQVLVRGHVLVFFEEDGEATRLKATANVAVSHGSTNLANTGLNAMVAKKIVDGEECAFVNIKIDHGQRDLTWVG